MFEMSVWAILLLAIVAILFNRKGWLLFLITSLALAFTVNIIDWCGLALSAFGIIVAWAFQRQQGWRRYLLHGFLVIWAVALARHILPGFNNLLVLDHVFSGPLSSPFSLYLNIDKPMIIFAFILLMPSMLIRPKDKNRRALVASAILLLALLPLLGTYMGLIKAEFSLPNWLVLFSLSNLFITCVSEEVFFRGYLQNVFSKYGTYWPVIISGVLFGLAHYSGGLGFMVLAGIAGVCYGLIYLATGRLYLAILAHFAFNLYHLVFYTYPLYRIN